MAVTITREETKSYFSLILYHLNKKNWIHTSHSKQNKEKNFQIDQRMNKKKKEI